MSTFFLLRKENKLIEYIAQTVINILLGIFWVVKLKLINYDGNWKRISRFSELLSIIIYRLSHFNVNGPMKWRLQDESLPVLWGIFCIQHFLLLRTLNLQMQILIFYRGFYAKIYTSCFQIFFSFNQGNPDAKCLWA